MALLLIPYCLAMTILLVTSTLFCLLLKDMLLTRHDTFSRARNSCTSVMTPLGSTFLFGGSPHNFMWPFTLLCHLTKLLKALKLQTYLIRSIFLELCKVHTCVAIKPNLLHTSNCKIIATDKIHINTNFNSFKAKTYVKTILCIKPIDIAMHSFH